MTIDKEYFDNITARIDSIDNPIDLQKITDKAFEAVNIQLSDINIQVSYLKPIIALAHLSITDLGSVISAVKNIVKTLTGPALIAYAKYVTQIAEVTQSIVKLKTAINNAEERIKSSIKLPEINMPTLPDIDINIVED